MKVVDTDIADVKIIEPTVFSDQRGFFYESFNQDKFQDIIGRKIQFVQDNHSKSSKGVLRGLHYQLTPHPQGKLVRCTRGEVFDVAVDIRRDSPTFGKWVGVILNEDNKRQLWIPEGFAHGFVVLSESAEFLYKTTDFWNKDLERTIQWCDPDIAIDWHGSSDFILSDKDQSAPLLKDAEVF